MGLTDTLMAQPIPKAKEEKPCDRLHEVDGTLYCFSAKRAKPRDMENHGQSSLRRFCHALDYQECGNYCASELQRPEEI